MQRLPYMSDASIVPRVQKYLEANVDKTYVNIDVMADELQNTYREYAKRKRSAFRASVNKAYSIVLQSYNLDNQESSEDETILSSESGPSPSTSIQENKFGDSARNNELASVNPTSEQIVDNELIDISSDESEEAAPTYVGKISNGTHQDSSILITEKRSEKHMSDASEGSEKKRMKLEHQSVSTSKSYHKKKKNEKLLQKSNHNFKDLGGMDKILKDICVLLIHIKHPEIYKTIGVSPPRGLLLHGPPGCGKTLLGNAIGGELNISLLKIAAPELVAGVSGESEERIRELFDQAVSAAPCILFIDEIDAVTPNRQNAQREMERRIVAQLISCLDELNEREGTVLVIGATNRPDSLDPALRRRFDREISLGIPDTSSRIQILKVLTTNLRLTGNFDFEMLANYTPGFVGADLYALVKEAAMVAINRLFSELKEARNVAINIDKKEETLSQKVSDQVNPQLTEQDNIPEGTTITNETNNEVTVILEDNDNSIKNPCPAPYFSGDGNKDVIEVNKEQNEIVAPTQTGPQMTTLEELLLWLHNKSQLSSEQLQKLYITMSDFQDALKTVQPSAKREGFATVPDVTWDDIGSLRDIREELQMNILAPVRHSKLFEDLGINYPTGVLLCGPPGCGKTLLAKAIANEAGINFISVKGPELLNMYVGESERAVRICFQRARNSAPCVIFFDELDALCPKRSDSREGSATMRVVNQLLTEMDGIESRKGVFLLAASNRPDIIDPAVLRPGRLDKILFVGLPSPADRVDILRAITKNGACPRLAPDVNLEAIGKSESCQGYTGADLAALIREASVTSLKEFLVFGDTSERPVVVTTEHFTQAIRKIRPSVSEKDQKHYEKLRKLYSSLPDETEEMEYS